MLQSLRITTDTATACALPCERFLSYRARSAALDLIPAMEANQNALRKYGEPRLDIRHRVPLNSPDCFTDGSIPAKAASLSGASKRLTSPISATNTAASVLPTPTIVVSCVSNEESFSAMYSSSSEICSSRSCICRINCRMASVAESANKNEPKVFLARDCISRAFVKPNLPLETDLRKPENSSVSSSAIMSGDV